MIKTLIWEWIKIWSFPISKKQIQVIYNSTIYNKTTIFTIKLYTNDSWTWFHHFSLT
jgi:hypothetical protein